MSLLAQDGELTADLYREQLARNLVIARNAAGLTQHVLARRSRVSRATIAQIEADGGDPRLSTLALLAAALNISPVQLLLGTVELQSIIQLAHGDPALLTFGALDAVDPSSAPVDLGDRARDLATSPGAAVGAALGATAAPRKGAAVGAALAYLIEQRLP